MEYKIERNIVIFQVNYCLDIVLFLKLNCPDMLKYVQTMSELHLL